jgi:hypothetical protein
MWCACGCCGVGCWGDAAYGVLSSHHTAPTMKQTAALNVSTPISATVSRRGVSTNGMSNIVVVLLAVAKDASDQDVEGVMMGVAVSALFDSPPHSCCLALCSNNHADTLLCEDTKVSTPTSTRGHAKHFD